jgi:heterodisulfide reductase subunit B2
MKYGLFPGCSLQGSSREYGESFQAIAPLLGLELAEIPDWNCCGASAAHTVNRKLSVALPARTLALAERAGMSQVVVPCSACFNRLKVAHNELQKDADVRRRTSKIIDMEYRGTVEILNVLDVLGRCASEGLEGKVVRPFGHKVACYYGCYLTRPAGVVKVDRAEDPQVMDELMKAIGAEPIDWAFKVECCGAGFSVSRTDLVAKLSAKILADADRRGAEAIIVACPMCHSNLDLRRPEIEQQLGRSCRIPVLFISQAIGLALGVGERELGLRRHMVPVAFAEAVAAGREGA